MPRRPLALALAVAATAPRASWAQAQGPTTVDARPRRSVALTLVGAGTGGAALEASIRELLDRLGLTLVGEGDASSDGVLARVRVDLSATSSASLIVTDGQTGDVVEARSVARDASASVVREEIAHAVQSAVESKLLSDGDRPRPPPPSSPAQAPAVTPVVAAPPPPIVATPAPERPPGSENAPPPVRGSAFALDVATFLGGGGFASGTSVVARVGGGVSVASRRGLRPALAVSVAYALPFDSTGALVTSHTELVSGRAIASIELARTSWLALDVGAGGGFDAISVTPDSAVLPSDALGDHTLRTDPIATGMISARIPLATSVVFALDASADVALSTRSYVVDQAGAQSVVLAPWRVRPTLLAGFAFTALGEGLFTREREP